MASVWANVAALAGANVAATAMVDTEGSKTGIAGSIRLSSAAVPGVVFLLLPRLAFVLLYVPARVACVPFPTGQRFV